MIQNMINNDKLLLKLNEIYILNELHIYNNSFRMFSVGKDKHKNYIILKNDICLDDELVNVQILINNLTEKKYINASFIFIAFLSNDFNVNDYTSFNGNSFLHTISYNLITSTSLCDKKFYYLGSKKVKKLLSDIEEIFSDKHQTTKDPEQCLINIKRKIAEKTGITKCIDLDESSAAFSGTEGNYDLYVSIGVYKKRKKEHFSVYVDDHFGWDDCDYESQEEFEDSIVEFICEKINRTIKTITETKKHKYIRITEYYLDKETNEWVLMSDDKISWLIARPFITEDSVTEEIKEYQI